MNSGEHYASELASMEDRNEKYRLIVEALQHLRALTDPTPEQLREASDLALLATGWRATEEYPDTVWQEPDDGATWPRCDLPHPCADLTDAVKWMVPEKGRWGRQISARMWVMDKKKRLWWADGLPALALTIAGLAASLEDGK